MKFHKIVNKHLHFIFLIHFSNYAASGLQISNHLSTSFNTTFLNNNSNTKPSSSNIVSTAPLENDTDGNHFFKYLIITNILFNLK